MTPTPQQSHILSLLTTTSSNILVNALAGTGKTSTLELLQVNSPSLPILCLAFNKRIAEEMEKRFLSTTTVRTFNGLGHRIWAKTNASKLTLDPKKTQNLLKHRISGLRKSDQTIAWEEYHVIVDSIARAKALGYVPDGKFPNAKRLITAECFFSSLEETPSSIAEDLINKTLFDSIQAAYTGSIDFNDQIYMPALFGGTFPRFPLVLVDEAQDLSPTNHAMLDKLGRSRLIAVGDPWQSIYGFRGAKQRGMAALKEKFSMTEADLSVSFRCPKEIVKNVHWRVPHFQWIKEGGKVETLKILAVNDIVDNSAIICRNNAPLFKLAYGLLTAGRSVSVAGSDIGPKLLGTIRRLGDPSMSKASLLSTIEDWRAERLAKDSTTADDMADCMKVFASFGETLGQAMAYAEHLFSQKGSIKLLTGHKAKGLEWGVVYHLDPWLIGDSNQELNLRYVISTRAKQELYEIDGRNIQW